MPKATQPKKQGVSKPSKTRDAGDGIGADFVPRLVQDVLARRNPDGTISILRLDEDQYFYTIDGVAAEFWGMIDGRRSVTKIKEKLILIHSPPAALFEREVTQLLSKLRKEKLIQS